MDKIKTLGELATHPFDAPTNVSRRGFLLRAAGATAGAMVLGFGLPVPQARAAGVTGTIKPGTRVPAFLELRPDSTVRLLSPFMEGGQGIYTALAQMVGEELDVDPANFVVETAPPGPDYLVVNGMMRITGGSMSTHSSYTVMRQLGAVARAMLLKAASARMGVPVGELTTEPGRVLHKPSGRSLAYGELSANTLDMPAPPVESVPLRDPKTFRWIGKPVARLDMHPKATGQVKYAIDCSVEGMLHAAVQHAPRLGMTPGAIRNEAQLKAMRGVVSIHRLPGAVAVVCERWWDAKCAAEAADVEWQAPAADASRAMPADFASDAFRDAMPAADGKPEVAETEGDAAGVLAKASSPIEAVYHSQYLNHAQLEPPSALARYNTDGSLDLWFPNQAPEMFLADIVKRTGLPQERINLHSPMLGGFFGRHFLYETANPYPQAIQLAKETGRPIKLIWSREEEFLRDAVRPMASVQFRAAIGEDGMPAALSIVSSTEGPGESIANKRGEELDSSALEGMTGKQYAIPNRSIAQHFVKNPPIMGYWRSVGNSMNDFFYECFLDEMADAGGQDPVDLRRKLLKGNKRLTNLLNAVVDLSGGWKRGPFTAADGSTRARGIGMASPFGSESAAIAEVSIKDGEVHVHDIWEAIDPGSIVNPAIIEAQVNSAATLGVSQVLMEETVFQNGMPRGRNYDMYPILPLSRMPRVHVRIVESGEKMGGIGEPGLPPVPPAVANAVSHLTGKRVRSMPLSRLTFDA